MGSAMVTGWDRFALRLCSGESPRAVSYEAGDAPQRVDDRAPRAFARWCAWCGAGDGAGGKHSGGLRREALRTVCTAQQAIMPHGSH